MAQQIPSFPQFHGVPPPPPPVPIFQAGDIGGWPPPMPAHVQLIDPIVDQLKAINITSSQPNTAKFGLDQKLPQPVKVPTTYRGWTLRKAEPIKPSDEPNWSRVDRVETLLSSEQLLKIVKANGKTVKEDYKALGSENQRKQVDRLLEEQKYVEKAPNVEWKLAGIERELKRTGRREVKTQAIHVILKRQTKSSATSTMEPSKKPNVAVKTVDLKDPLRPAAGTRASTSSNAHYGRQAQQIPNHLDFPTQLPSYVGPTGMPLKIGASQHMPTQGIPMSQQSWVSGLGLPHPAAANWLASAAPAPQAAKAPGPQLPPLFGSGPLPPRYPKGIDQDGVPFVTVIEEDMERKMPQSPFAETMPKQHQQASRSKPMLPPMAPSAPPPAHKHNRPQQQQQRGGWPGPMPPPMAPFAPLPAQRHNKSQQSQQQQHGGWSGPMTPPMASDAPQPAQKFTKSQQPQPAQRRKPPIKLNQMFHLPQEPPKGHVKAENKVQDWYAARQNSGALGSSSSEDEDEDGGSSTFSEYTPPTTPEPKISLPARSKPSERRGSIYASSPEIHQQPIYREHQKARPTHQRHASFDSKESSPRSSARYFDGYVETTPERSEAHRRRRSSLYEAPPPPPSRRHSIAQQQPSGNWSSANTRPYIHQRSRTDNLFDTHATRYRDAYDDAGLWTAYAPRSLKHITVAGERRRGFYDDGGFGRRSREGEYRDRIVMMGLREEEMERRDRERERAREAERIAQVLRDRELEAKIERAVFEDKLRREKEDGLFGGRYW